MNDNQNWNKLGEQFRDVLSDALQSGDFKDLNRLVSQTVVNTLNEVGIHISSDEDNIFRNSQYHSEDFTKQKETDNHSDRNHQAEQSGQAGQYQQTRQNGQYRQAAQTGQFRQAGQSGQYRQTGQAGQTQIHPPHTANLSLVKMKKKGNVSGILYQVFGGIGLGIAGLVAFFHLPALFFGTASIAGWIINIAFLLFFLGMVRLGIMQRKRLKRAQRYVQCCDYRMFGEIEKLAKNIGKKERYVRKDLQKMLKLGMFPEGHLDEQKTCLMLNDVVYQQYLEAENNRKLREADSLKSTVQQEDTQSVKDSSDNAESTAHENELNTMIAEGMEYIHKLKDLNDRIEGEVISTKLFRLEGLLKDIFDSIREHPEQMHRMHNLMNYYLHTTVKMVEAYEEFDKVNTPGEEIIKAKLEIENTLDTINQAFTELLNNLFQDAVFDATTDAQVLKTMLAREGLTKNMDFTANT